VSARLRTPPPKPDAKQGARAVQLSEDDDEQVYICRLHGFRDLLKSPTPAVSLGVQEGTARIRAALYRERACRRLKTTPPASSECAACARPSMRSTLKRNTYARTSRPKPDARTARPIPSARPNDGAIRASRAQARHSRQSLGARLMRARRSSSSACITAMMAQCRRLPHCVARLRHPFQAA
jgi:hypothetical protein